jgi:hypothetical protein
MPLIRPDRLRRVFGRLAPQRNQQEEQGSPVCSAAGPVTYAGARRSRTMGCERGQLLQVATRLR